MDHNTLEKMRHDRKTRGKHELALADALAMKERWNGRTFAKTVDIPAEVIRKLIEGESGVSSTRSARGD